MRRVISFVLLQIKGYNSSGYSKRPLGLRKITDNYNTQGALGSGSRKDRSLTPSQIAKKKLGKKSGVLTGQGDGGKMLTVQGKISVDRRIKTHSITATNDILKSGSPRMRKKRSGTGIKRNTNSLFESKNGVKKSISSKAMQRFQSTEESGGVTKIKAYSPSRDRVIADSRRHHSSSSNQHYSLAPQGGQYPGSPSTLSPEYLLDVNKYEGALTEIEGLRITSHCINHQDKLSEYYVINDERVKRLTNQNPNFLRLYCF